MRNDKIVWFNENTETFYNRFNKVYELLLKSRYPNVFKVEIDPYSFNEAVVSQDRWKFHHITVKVCANFSHIEKSKYELRTGAHLGVTIVKLFDEVKNLLLNQFLENKILSVFLDLNEKEFCE